MGDIDRGRSKQFDGFAHRRKYVDLRCYIQRRRGFIKMIRSGLKP